MGIGWKGEPGWGLVESTSHLWPPPSKRDPSLVHPEKRPGCQGAGAGLRSTGPFGSMPYSMGNQVMSGGSGHRSTSKGPHLQKDICLSSVWNTASIKESFVE